MRYLFAAVFLLGLVSPFAAQAECEMAVADLPEIHGVRLGRSRREVEKVYTFAPSSIVKKDSFKTGPDHLEGIWFDFYRDSLAIVEFDYDRNTEWKNVREFAAHLEYSLKLPIDSWVFIDRTEAVIKCDGFRASISSVRNTLTLTDNFASAAAKRNVAHGGRMRERIAGQ